MNSREQGLADRLAGRTTWVLIIAIGLVSVAFAVPDGRWIVASPGIIIIGTAVAALRTRRSPDRQRRYLLIGLGILTAWHVGRGVFGLATASGIDIAVSVLAIPWMVALYFAFRRWPSDGTAR